MSYDPIYGAWNNMKKRCLNPLDAHYADYGGRGISICDRWMIFANFASDMGPKPSPSHSLERLNNSGNYEPSNCCWTTDEKQRLNKRNRIFIDYEGRRVTVQELHVLTGIPITTIRLRRSRGYKGEDLWQKSLLDRRPVAKWMIEASIKARSSTHCRRGHEFTEGSFWKDKKGCRVCKACVRINQHAYYLRTKGRSS